ncbi:copper radical oxidase [Rickenella mellea]|uniref:Copper radical oxidase n=1 Tax=Rickenella mellea TaxID=50990 RepID=A0A4Y7Q822_9AGAM|nr:copper radical oxidase [Rickenella mellea]
MLKHLVAICSLPLMQTAAFSPPHVQAARHFHPRQSVTTLPGNWTSKGCWTDNPAARTLSASTFLDTNGMTVESCINFCWQGNFIFAGTEFAQECYCDNIIENGATNASLSDCNMACKGNAAESCGGPNRLNLFWSGATPPPPPTTLPSFGLWVSLGCYNDTAAARTLTTGMAVTGKVSVQTCTTACFNAGFPLSGVEFADECYCGTHFSNFGAPASDGCNMVCAGNSSEFCGGPNRLNVYNYTGTDLPTAPPNNPPAGGGGGGAPVFPVTNGLPTPWNYSGCYIDNAHGRVLGTELPDNSTITVEACINFCISQNMTLAGLEFSVQCFCGNQVINGGVLASDPTTCNMGCGGNSTEACGGPNRMSIYTSTPNVTLLPVPVTQNTSLPGHWQYQGCIAEPGAARVFPYQNILTNNNSATNCLTLCSTYGYPAGGMEFGDECYCGDVADIQANGGQNASETDCSFACSGDPIHLCGGAERISLYFWVSDPPLNVWHTPANTGQYKFLIGGLIVPLIATLGVNNKVTFLEKWGTGPPNTTGAYELDLTLTNDFTKAWREMHVKTDVFCSGSVIMPDKAARIINVGGWSLSSTFGIRIYTPDGSAGVNGTNDWEENVQELSLQRGRWYPGSMVMANGSILVVGGEQGSNGAPEPTLEILPTPTGGPTFLPMDWLLRTDPNNLYPFLFVLPHGGVLVIYYNEARILDEVSFATTRVLPNLPGAVNNFLAGRTYPMEGTAVLLPQHAPYSDPLTVLTCGGSTIGAAVALDNCVSITPEVPNANWTIERMPSKRVMTCMVALPDGTYMIMNGAQQGVAGFGLATDPNLQALLYDPSQPLGQRISILSTTIVDRLYHSEAILLHDGRVLVSGSDPEDTRFPQEYRVEVYIPPYLSSGLKQPSFTISGTDWTYSSSHQITVQLFQGSTSGMRVSLISAVSSTHGNSMGQRTIFPAFSCSGNTCTVTAPPNAHVCPPGWFQLFVLDGPTPSLSQWVRIGGDPAQLGNWPNFPDFTHPGV